MIREVQEKDGCRILEIYRMGLIKRSATFETKVPEWSTWKDRYLGHSRFVYLFQNKVIGWVALSPVSYREVYRGVAEVSIYVDPEFQGKGVGTKLLQQAIISSEQYGVWTLQSSVFPENMATVHLHLKLGFRIVGKRIKIAKLDGHWKDTFILEKRSSVVI